MKKDTSQSHGLESFTVARKMRLMYIKVLEKSMLFCSLFIANFIPPKDLWLLTNIYTKTKW